MNPVEAPRAAAPLDESVGRRIPIVKGRTTAWRPNVRWFADDVRAGTERLLGAPDAAAHLRNALHSGHAIQNYMERQYERNRAPRQNLEASLPRCWRRRSTTWRRTIVAEVAE